MSISVAIVEDNNDIRLALEQIIESSDKFTLSGSCSSGGEALRAGANGFILKKTSPANTDNTLNVLS